MELKELSLNDCEQVRIWRNQVPEMLRTPFLLTKEMQERFYHEVICDRNARARFWGVWSNGILGCKDMFVGMAGLENISWENRIAEISLILDPALSTSNNMTVVLELLLKKAFDELNLENVFTEVYQINSYTNFWLLNVHKKYNHSDPLIMLPGRKYYKGIYFDSFYINISKERYNENSVY